MRKEVADKWIAALRSGEYQQTTSSLRDGDAFCCLGVLCDLHAKETGGEWQDGTYCHIPGDESLGVKVLPDSVIKWSGVLASNPVTGVPRLLGEVNPRCLTLAELNDFRAYTFDQIADQIEQDWVRL